MKAKDLRGKNIEDLDEGSVESGEEGKEEDAVTAAYENISKKLESIRKGRESDDSEESKESEDSDKEEVELEEWKGPRKPVLEVEESEEEEEPELRKVKLRNLEDVEEGAEVQRGKEAESDEDLDEGEGGREAERQSGDDKELGKKEWEPEEGDPLDEDGATEEREVTEETEETKEKEERDFESDNLERPRVIGGDSEDAEVQSGRGAKSGEEESEGSKESEESKGFDNGTAVEAFESEREISEPEEKEVQPDTLDDLASHDFKEGRTIKDIAGEDDYFIPHLKGSGQREGSLSYNTHPQREGIGDSYSPKGNMEGSDPNNYFSAHQQPQAPKRANKFHLLVLLLIGVAVIGFTVYILKGGFGEISMTAQPSPSPSATATPEPTPTPTPEPTVERSNFTVKVLNGTTTSGLAGKIRDKLKELGYKTVTPGNNSDTDVAQTKIRVKEGSQSADLLQRLTLDLAPDYEATEGEKLDKKAVYDAEVILGAK